MKLMYIVREDIKEKKALTAQKHARKNGKTRQ